MSLIVFNVSTCQLAMRNNITWVGVVWFIEGDIAQCFTSLDHSILLDTLSERMHDGRFLRLISDLLTAGYAGGLEVPRNLQWYSSRLDLQPDLDKYLPPSIGHICD
jgi:hypothetical protein